MPAPTKGDIFRAVIESNKGIIYKVARAYCKNNDDRKDLIQEITIQVWRSFDTYREQYKRSTWMYRIALNVAISFYRKNARRQNIALPYEESLILEIPNEEMPDAEHDYTLLQRCIAELKELDKALMVLYLEEHSHKEIAEIMGISETNVSTKIGRIKEKLKQRFLELHSINNNG